MENILRTKLFIPKNRTDLVARPRLLEQLHGGIQKKLILISAPAGYGKTSLISHWLADIEKNNDHRICWLSVEEDDNDPHQFFLYLAAATEGLPGGEISLSKLLQVNQPFSAKQLMKAFLQDIMPVENPFILVLDDFHSIDSAELDEAMQYMLDLMPPQMTLLLLSRSDPGFPISRLRARGELLELRAEDLRFSDEETAQFIEETMRLALSPVQISALKKRTEGWIAGLKMAAISIQNRSGDDIAGFVENFTGSHRFIMDYLRDEVLNQVSTEEQSFLLSTAVLHQFCDALCDAVLPAEQYGEAQRILEKLEAGNSFLIALDDERHWYRYHHLFADLLRQKLPIAEAHTARQKAAVWCAENGFISDAIEYALAAQAWDIAIPLLVQHGLSYVFKGKLVGLRHWFDLLPREKLLAEPRMCLDYAWVLVNQGHQDQVEPYLKAAEEASSCAAEIRSVTALIRSNIARTCEELSVMEREASLALELMPADYAVGRCTALLQLGAAALLSESGSLTDAVANLLEAVKLARQSSNMNSLILSGGYLGLAYLRLHETDLANNTLKRTMQSALEADLEHSPLLIYVHVGLAHLAYLNGKIDQAREGLNLALAQGCHADEVSGMFRSYFLLAVLEAKIGNMEAARAAYGKIKEAAPSIRNPQAAGLTAQAETLFSGGTISEELLERLRMVAAGASSLEYSKKAARSDVHIRAALPDPLSDRELEILALLASGLKNQEIAERMYISLNTVLFHTKNIYLKLGVNKRTQALLKAQEYGLLTKSHK